MRTTSIRSDVTLRPSVRRSEEARSSRRSRMKSARADEPTGNLDIASAAEVLDLFKSLCADESKSMSILMVTHDPVLASKADRMLLLRDGQTVASDIRSAWGLDEGGEEE